jgi:hypothetical protein
MFYIGCLAGELPGASAVLQPRQFKHVLKAAEERALHAIKELWEQNGMRVCTNMRLSLASYKNE